MNGPTIFSLNARFDALRRPAEYAETGEPAEPDTAPPAMPVAAPGKASSTSAASAEADWRTLSAPHAALVAVQAGAVSAAQTAHVARATLVLAAASAARATSSGNSAPANVAADTANTAVAGAHGVVSQAARGAAAAAGQGASVNAVRAGVPSSAAHPELPQKEMSATPPSRPAALRPGTTIETDAEDFGEILRHELNNPLTGILGNAELLLAEIRRSEDGRLPRGGVQRLETIAALAVRLRETIRRISQEWLVEGSVARKKSDS
jgi:two-component system, NtrC family, sensor kinase